MIRSCPACGYDLSGLNQPERCPECGERPTIIWYRQDRDRACLFMILSAAALALSLPFVYASVLWELTYGAYGGRLLQFALTILLHAVFPCIFSVVLIGATRRWRTARRLLREGSHNLPHQ